MNLMKLPPFEKREGLLDAEEKVREARRSLEAATEEEYKLYDEAKRAAREEARTIILDCLFF